MRGVMKKVLLYKIVTDPKLTIKQKQLMIQLLERHREQEQKQEKSEPSERESIVQEPKVQELELQTPILHDTRVRDPRVYDPRATDHIMQKQEPRPRIKDSRVQDPRIKDSRVQDPRIKELIIKKRVLVHNESSVQERGLELIQEQLMQSKPREQIQISDINLQAYEPIEDRPIHYNSPTLVPRAHCIVKTPRDKQWFSC
jgi:hypothetical protein